MRVVISSRAEARAVVDTALYQGRLITDYVMFNFWIRAKTPGQAQAQLAAQTVAQLLHGLLTHPSTRAALAVKGIAHLQPPGPGLSHPQRGLCGAAADLRGAVAIPGDPDRPGG